MQLQNKIIDNIYVTRPFLPPLEEFLPYLEKIWENKRLTNQGPFHQEFEEALAQYLDVPYVSLFANGTLALLTALKALDIKGEVITTPYSFVATSHALSWNNVTPVFVDVDPVYGNLDPEKIEQAITDKTTAILPVHVYGNPCAIDVIQSIADRHGLKVIYDAAHAFGVEKDGKSVVRAGDLSVLSFHATKVFHTFEGGAVVCKDSRLKQHIDYLKNFGFRDEQTVIEVGINAKMNELQAAMGLLQLNYIDEEIVRRKKIFNKYKKELNGIPGISIIKPCAAVRYNYSYLPILVNANQYGISRDQLFFKMKNKGVNARRYFYPLISDFEPYHELESSGEVFLPVAQRISQSVICLPLFSELDDVDVQRVVELIK